MNDAESPAREFLIKDASTAMWALRFALLQKTAGFVLLVAIGLDALSPAWGWLGLALLMHAIASRLHDMLWRIWLETVPPDELARRLKVLS